MSLEAAYLERAERNERLLATLDIENTEFLDWAATIAFYVALRYVDAYFFPDRPGGHRRRLQWVRERPETRPIFISYRELYNELLNTRYELMEITVEQVQTLIHDHLNNVKSHILQQ